VPPLRPWLRWTPFLLALVCGGAWAETDGPPRSAADAGVSGSACIPSEARGHLTLARLGDAPALCWLPEEPIASLGLRCWSLDVERRSVWRHRVPALPGRSLPAKLEGGCLAGLCPHPAPREGRGPPLVAMSTDGSHVALRVGCGLFVFDAATSTQTARIELCTAGDSGPLIRELLFVGDRLYLSDVAGGPFIGVLGFDATGASLEAIDAGGRAVSVFNGSMNALDSSHFGAAGPGLLSLTVVGRDGQTRTLKRRTPNNPCTPDEMESDFDRPAHPRCKAFLERLVYPFVDASLVLLADGRLLVLLDGGAARSHRFVGPLAVLDGRTLAEQRRFEPPWCPAPRRVRSPSP
jgi:hypothetical protein